MALAPLLTLFAALSAEERKPDVLLVTLDTTRADRLGCYGHAAARTPFLDQLAAEGTRFTKAWCAAPITLPSHATLLTARPPVGHGARDNGLYRLDPAATTLAEVLAAHGFATGAFVGCFVLDARFGLAQGFAAYDAPAATALGSKAQVIERPAAAVVDAALAWLDTVPATQPFFLWLHFYEPHAPYAPPAAQRDLAEPYDGEIAACDAQLARFHAELAKLERGAPLLEWVTADHGEALGEHGEATHGLLLHDATMRVPLLARGPGVLRDALREAPVSNGSIAPTLLAQLALDAALLPDADYPPLPLAAPVAGEVAPEPLPLLLETWLPLHSHGWTPLRGLVAGDKKLVSGSFDELFDLAADPREERDLASKRPEETARWREQLEVEFVRATGGGDGTRTVDEAERAALAALGYVDASATAVDGSERPDPRAAIADEAAQQAAMAKYQQARRILGQDAMLQGVKPPPLDERKKQRAMKLLEEARATLAGLEERHPDDPSVAFDLGNVLLSMNRQAEAIPRFELAVVCDPKSPQRHFNLAVAYAGAGHAIAGIRQMEKAIHVEPRLITAYRWLVSAHEARNEIGRATWWADRLAAQKLVEGAEQVTLTRSRMQLYDRMEKAGQRVQPPPTFPPKDLDPVGVDAR